MGFQLQVAELPLVECIHRPLRWKDGVEIVAVPFHPALVEVLAVLHSDEMLLKEDNDEFYHSVF